jgi:heme-degrading monooxygenase HmoA
MVIVMIDLNVTDVNKVLPIMAELRKAAVLQKGYISGNTLVGEEDKSQIRIQTIWQSALEWKEWEKSQTQINIFRKLLPFLLKKSERKIYRYLTYNAEPHIKDEDSV